MAEPARHPRDSQRSRVYRAESPISPSPLPGLDACATFIDRVVGSLWWAQRFPDHAHDCVPRLRPGNGARQAFFRPGDPRYDGGDPTITLPRRYRTKGVVLHELTHWALWDEPLVAHHGSTFARLHLDLTEEFLGAPRAAQLEAGYVAERVRIGRAPRAAPDGRLRYGWDERLRLGRGRHLTIRYTTEAGTDVTTGVLVGLTPGGRRIRLLDPCGAAEVATDAVFAIDLVASQ
ncbi:MAG TPA: hypothetical protein VFW06_09970 [Acidimicrobiia bacterium]|nr:hypothetical protein [Acidimicrobiia bacterium]